MNDIKPTLKALGLLDSEIATYMAAFRAGASTVLELTKITGLSRQASYVAIETLTSRGLMTSFLRGKKRYYASEHPDRLLTYARKQQETMRELVSDLGRSIPELELQMGGERPKVRVFEGREGMGAIFEDLRHSHPKEIFEISDTAAFEKAVEEKDVKPLQEYLIKNQVRVHGVFTSPTGEKPATQRIKGDRIYLPQQKWNFRSDIFIYGDKVALIALKGKQNSVIIESKDIADGLRALFSQALKK